MMGEEGETLSQEQLAALWEESGSLNKIDKSSIHRICSGQVVLDMPSAVKELIENAIDAKATNIRILLEKGGFACVQVTDNGSGILISDYHSIALKHFTSKIKNFRDLQDGISSLGFRGEALSSLCSLSSQVSISTRTKDDLHGVYIRYDKNGNLLDVSPVSHPVGTTVKVEHIFIGAPVRLQNFKKNHKREYNKVLSLVQEYSISHNDVLFQLTAELYNSTSRIGNNVPKVILSTTGSGELKDAIASVYGAKQILGLDVFSFTCDHLTASGYVSKLEGNCGRKGGARQFFTLNRRPVDMPRMTRLFNELYRKSNPSRTPALFLALQMKDGTFDINVTPNKRTVIMEYEKIVLDALREYLTNHHWSNQSTTYTPAPAPTQRTLSASSLTSPSFCFTETIRSLQVSQSSQRTVRSNSSPILISGSPLDDVESISSPSPSPSPSPSSIKTSQPIIEPWQPTPKRFREQERNTTRILSSVYQQLTGVDALEIELRQLLQDNTIFIQDNHDLIEKQIEKFSSVPVHAQHTSEMIISTSIQDIRKRKAKKLHYTQTCSIPHGDARFSSDLDSTHDESYEELERKFDKEDFGRLGICGQFNSGFIIGKAGNELFIFDQHACDEKFNYERLYRHLDIKVQPMIQPQALQLSPADEDIIISEREILRKNGFHFDYKYEEEPGKRISLTTLPYSKNTTFSFDGSSFIIPPIFSLFTYTMLDVAEMIQILRESPGTFCRPSKIKSMLASRACRSSIMIGKSLSPINMKIVINNMQGLENPWCCPHGRPTMRHLFTFNKSSVL